jgi:hypothetical protein
MDTPLLEVFWQSVVLHGYTDEWITLSTGIIKDGLTEVYAFSKIRPVMERIEVYPEDIQAWAKCVETVLIECKQEVEQPQGLLTCWTFLVCDRIYTIDATS